MTEALQAVFAFDGWVLHTMPRELSRHGERVALQDQPLQILQELVSHPHELVTREQLVARLWPRGVVDFDGSLNTAVRKLRAALHDDADTPRYIETLPRQGYRFIGQLERGPAAAAPAPARRMKWLIAAVALLALAAALWLLRPAAQSEQRRFRVAVLPFENLSPDPADAFFTDGLHEAVISTLASRATNVDVISRTTMLSFRATNKPVRTIARELGVTHVLEGSVRREKQRVRLSLQLIDASTDTTLSSQIFEGDLASAMNLQSEVAAAVAQRLAVKLSANSEQLPPSTSPEAYDLYLKARLKAQGFEGRASREKILEVEAWLDRAIGLDPTFAAAYLERSRVRLRMFANSYDLSAANLQGARADLDKARALAGEVPLMLMTESWYAQIVDWDMDEAHRLLQMPQVVASRDVAVLMDRAALLATAHQPDDALALYAQAGALDPANPGLVENWLAVLWNARRPAEALRMLQAHGDRAAYHTSFAFDFTGQAELLDEHVNPVYPNIDAGSKLMARVYRFRMRNHLGEAIDLLRGSEAETIRQDSFSPVSIPAIGRKPVAELHGWLMLLTGDATAAARDGAILRKFVAAEPVTKWNGWFLHVLAAEGELFAGNKSRAVAEVRIARTMIPDHLNVAVDRYLPITTAMILAWTGAGDDATTLLEKLSTDFPGVGPAEIVRDPLFTVPLANNARFKNLAFRLETEVQANRKLFDAAR